MACLGTPILICDGVRSQPLEPLLLEGARGSSFDEAWLQRLVHAHPACLPIDQIEPGFQAPVSVCMELPTRHGFVDNLLLTPDGNVVIVETKLWRNPESRRKVVVQALDYATCLFEMDYSALEEAALRGNFGERGRPSSLYELMEGSETLDEPRFVDAVNTNLRSGRILILVVGDGIRSETERLVSSLQSHAGFHFTLALVELAIHRLPEAGIVVQPRTLVQTQMIHRGVVTIDDRRASVRSSDETKEKNRKPTPGNITAEQFFDAMDERQPGLARRLQDFIADLERLGVYPEYKRSLNLKWDPPSGKSVNVAYIQRNGHVWTDASNWFVPTDLSHRYIENLAEVLGLEVERDARRQKWYVRSEKGAPRIEDIAGRLGAAIPVIEKFIDSVRQRLVETGAE